MINSILPSEDAPVDHHGDPLPGPEGRHALQLLVGDPYWNEELLGVARAQSVGDTENTDKLYFRFVRKIFGLS